MCFPAKSEFKSLSPPCSCCFPVEIFVSPSKIMQVPSQIMATKFISPVTIFSIPAENVYFHHFPAVLLMSGGVITGGVLVNRFIREKTQKSLKKVKSFQLCSQNQIQSLAQLSSFMQFLSKHKRIFPFLVPVLHSALLCSQLNHPSNPSISPSMQK